MFSGDFSALEEDPAGSWSRRGLDLPALFGRFNRGYRHRLAPVAHLKHHFAGRGGEQRVVRADADSWVSGTAARYDVALCDPPYGYDGWGTLIDRIPADLVVLESAAELAVPPGWEVLRSKRYGGTIVTVARPERATQKGLS